MAIQVYRQENNFNSPIGVAGVSQAPTRFANSFVNMTENIASNMFERDAQDQKDEAIRQVNTMTVRENGNLVVKELPESFSRIQKRAAQPVVDRIYATQIELDVRAKTAELAREHPNDPDGFLKALSGWQEGYQSSVGQYANIADVAIQQYGIQSAESLYVDKANYETRIAFNNSNKLLDSNIKDASSVVAGYTQQDFDMYQADEFESYEQFLSSWKNKLTSEAEELNILYPTKYDTNSLNTDKNRIEKIFASPPFLKAMNEIENTVFSNNPEEQKQSVEAMTNNISLALQGNKNALQNLAPFGITQETLNQVPQGIKEDIASDMATISNRVAENANLLMEQRQNFATEAILMSGGVVTEDRLDKVFKKDGIETPEQFINYAFSVPENGGPEPIFDENNIVNKLINNKRQALPKIVREAFSQENMLEMIAQSDFSMQTINRYVKLYNNFTRTQTNQYLNRGFSDETADFMISLEVLSRSAQASNIRGVLGTLTDPNVDLKALRDRKLGDQSMSEFVNDFMFERFFFDKELSDAEFNYVNKLAPQLLGVYSKENTKDIIEQTLKRRFYQKGSKYMVPDFNVSQFAPEILYAKEDLEYFDTMVDLTLQTIDADQIKVSLNGEKPQIGKNVFLMEPRYINARYPDYIAVNEDNVPLRNSDGELVIIPKNIMEGHHEKQFKDKEAKILDFKSKASQGPFMPQPASSGNISSQAEEIARANENR